MKGEFWWGVALVTPTVIALIAIIAAFGKYREWKGTVNADIQSFKEFMNEIRGDIKKIFDRLPPSPITEGASPIKLTDFGTNISHDIGAKKWANLLAPKLVSQVQNQQEFEIYRFCEKYVADMKLDDNLQLRIQEVAYNHNISTASVMEIFPIELRDELLSLLNLYEDETSTRLEETR